MHRLRRLLRICAAAALAAALLALPAGAAADPLTKPEGKEGCLADAASSLPADTCETAKAIDDTTDIAISPDGKFAYAAAFSSNSIAVFSRDADTGKLTQLDGTAGCLAWDGNPIAGCAAAAGLQGPTAIALSPDGKNAYVTTFQLDPGASPPVIRGQLTTFTRDETTGTLSQTACVSGSQTVALMSAPAPSGCSNVTFPGSVPARGVPIATASDVEVSPDGKSVITSSFLQSAIVNWDRNPGNGALTPKECFGSSRTMFPTSDTPLGPLTDVCGDGPPADTGGEALGMAYPLDVEISSDGQSVYAAALGLEQDATMVGPIEVVPATDEPGSVAKFDRDATGGTLTQAATPCIDDTRDQVQPSTTCAHRTGLLNPFRVSASPDDANVYVSSLNVFPPSGIAGPGPGELSQFRSDLSQLDPPCLQQLGLPAGGLEPTAGCSLTSLGLILPSDIAFSPDGGSAYVSSLFHSVGSYVRGAGGALTQDAPTTGCSIDPRNLLTGTELLASVCQNAIPLNAPTSIELSPDGNDAYVTSGGFLTGDPNFGPQFAAAGIESDDAITQLSVTRPPEEPPVTPPDDTPTCKGKPATIVAAAGQPTRGTKGADVIAGTDGKDKIKGGGGDDTICGFSGKDKVAAAGGDDVVIGALGPDALKGGGGDDLLIGGGGKDKVAGGPGDDKLVGGPGMDRLVGGPGDDRCAAKGNDGVRGCE